jgi:hypothetical protein
MVNAGLCMRLIFQPAGFHVQAKIIWWQPGWVDSALILWNTFMGLGQIFWIGQFVLFSEYIRYAVTSKPRRATTRLARTFQGSLVEIVC